MNKVVETALKYVGVKESPAGSNMTEFGKWFGLNGKAWCGMFASFCYNEAGHPLGTIDFKKGFAGCPFAVKHFTAKGEVVTFEQSQGGDLVFFDWDGNGKWDHVAILEYKSGKAFVTIEGNTAIGNDSNGGEVMRRGNSWVPGTTLGDLHVRNLTAKTKVLFVHPKVLDKAA